ncbi:tRNA uracil 4-sulfurtransferase ThiI [Pleionea sp. CnH1-48]|uniref:tRNA uracil 4-sulfurtransferase ThiI n=1 Tax=Pleionea sp. CnH1-48 TaxID=2954494 RepID=UPI002096FCA4|nr:tRNA uracil 4-sulfurtransferase ThiI [Pleionea sp. CnH1-48]MCO7225311.1 tRNA 4-thiouridine(8) synthase ThiI [Pleionea sp. CnH1-48]
MKLVVKLFHEIVVKSKPVRKLFVTQLRRNLTKLIQEIVPEAKVFSRWDKIEVEMPDIDSTTWEVLKERLQCTPGIDFVYRVDSHEFNELDDVAQLCIRHYAEDVKDKSFCVRIKRKGKHSFTSSEAERQIGGAILHNTEARQVDLHNPEYLLQLEIIDQTVALVREKIEGLGGYPLGQQEAVLSLISGGFDSTVSSYLMTRRGILTHFCFFNLGGLAHEIGVKQVASYLWQKYGSTQRVKFVSVPFEEVVNEILQKVDSSLMGVVLKRMMLRAAEKVAEDLALPAIVTGEAVGQVSSQTLTNLNVINECSNATVLRPLISMDKQDIIAIARDIGTEDFAASMPEYCGVISRKPTTRAKLDKVLETESDFDFSVLDNAIAEKKIVSIHQVLEGVVTDTNVEVIATPDVNDVIIDVRHPDEESLSPLMLTNNKILKIPFYSISNRLEELDKNTRYLLYCDKGVMSQVQAHQLTLQGFDNIKVFRN